MKAKIVKVQIVRLEGENIIERTYEGSLHAAQARLQDWAETAPVENEGSDKCAYICTFDNHAEMSGKLDLTRNGTYDIRALLRYKFELYAGVRVPDNMAEKDHASLMRVIGEKRQRIYKRLLETMDI